MNKLSFKKFLTRKNFFILLATAVLIIVIAVPLGVLLNKKSNNYTTTSTTAHKLAEQMFNVQNLSKIMTSDNTMPAITVCNINNNNIYNILYYTSSSSNIYLEYDFLFYMKQLPTCSKIKYLISLYDNSYKKVYVGPISANMTQHYNGDKITLVKIVDTNLDINKNAPNAKYIVLSMYIQSNDTDFFTNPENFSNKHNVQTYKSLDDFLNYLEQENPISTSFLLQLNQINY